MRYSSHSLYLCFCYIVTIETDGTSVYPIGHYFHHENNEYGTTTTKNNELYKNNRRYWIYCLK